jgi:hypothetical protein
MVRKFELEREELEGALATNGNLQPKKFKHNVQKQIVEKTLEPLKIPCFTPCTHMSNS